MTSASPTVRLPWTQRVNLRLWLLIAVVGTLVGYPVYQFVDAKITGGVKVTSDAQGEIRQVDLKAISLFEMDQEKATNEDVPAKWLALDGKRVSLTGEMYIGRQAAGGQSDFNLVYSIAKCCFNGPPKIQHFVKCKVMAGKHVEYHSNLVTAKGTFHVGIERDSETGAILSVYRLDVDSLRQVE